MSSEAAPIHKPVVHIIDDDRTVRDGLANLLCSADLAVESFSSPSEFLQSGHSARHGCVMLDIQFPDECGLDFQARLQSLELQIPVILMTGYADVPSSVRGMKAGAVDFLIKPFDEQSVLDAVATAFERDAMRIHQESQTSRTAERYASLTKREREVFALVTKGLMNKQVAALLNLSEITVKVHRGTMMRKMKLRTLADLVRAAGMIKYGVEGF